MSTRCTVVTCAETRLLMTMCSAIFCRILLIGSTRVLAVGCGWAWGVAGAGAAAGGLCGAGSILIDAGHHSINAHGLALLYQHVREYAGGRRGDFRIDLLGRDLKQWLVAFDCIARLLQPFCQRSFDDTLAHLGHHDVC